MTTNRFIEAVASELDARTPAPRYTNRKTYLRFPWFGGLHFAIALQDRRVSNPAAHGAIVQSPRVSVECVFEGNAADRFATVAAEHANIAEVLTSEVGWLPGGNREGGKRNIIRSSRAVDESSDPAAIARWACVTLDEMQSALRPYIGDPART